MSTTKGATPSQKQQEKRSLAAELKLALIEETEAQKGAKMAKATRSLTILLGKLGIGGEKFVTDYDKNRPAFFLHGSLARPPWKTGIHYGIDLREAVTWVKKYLRAGKAKQDDSA